jgi:hypothetical protein
MKNISSKKESDMIEREHRKKMLEIVSRIPDGLPEKWKKIAEYAISGLTDIGFSQDEQFLLVVSGQGRGVFDCFSGKKVARDLEVDGSWINEQNLTCQGIGPIAGEEIQLAGINGGGLRSGNDEGDQLLCISPYWPKKEIILCPDWQNCYTEEGALSSYKMWRGYELRAFGFSPSGMTFVIGESSDVTIYSIK